MGTKMMISHMRPFARLGLPTFLVFLCFACVPQTSLGEAATAHLGTDVLSLNLPGHWRLKSGYDSVFVGDLGQVVTFETSVLKDRWPAEILEDQYRDEEAKALKEVENLPTMCDSVRTTAVQVWALAQGGAAFSSTVQKPDLTTLELILILRPSAVVRVTIESSSLSAHAPAHSAVRSALDSMVWTPLIDERDTPLPTSP